MNTTQNVILTFLLKKKCEEKVERQNKLLVTTQEPFR